MVVLARTRFGRNVYMIGGNAGRFAADGHQQRKNVAETVYDDLGARGAGRLHHVGAHVLRPADELRRVWSLTRVTAAVLGGVAMSGGIGSLGGALIGLFIMQGFNNGLMMLNVPSFWQTVSRGLLLIAALSFDFVRNRRTKLK